MKRVTASNTLKSKPTSLFNTILLYGLNCIFGASGPINTVRLKKGRNVSLIETNSTQEQVCEKRFLSFLAHLTPVFLNKASKETLISAGLVLCVSLVAKRIMPYPSTGKPLFRAASRRTRLHLFLNTALPNLFGATKATSEGCASVDGATRIRRTEL